uniref:G-protein coupled receptors family 1 profile domain-containing protein n=1 Tax=Meloidogyne enterolobii TaxID=390850 RepID=A0A6V7X2S9_MELEN|nr:unnamed protein product [Meloidogyne enterolobii]
MALNINESNLSTNAIFGPFNDEYTALINAGISPIFVIPGIICSSIAIIGIPLNISVCYITVKYRKKYSALSSNTSILMIFNSFYEILHQSNHFYFLSVALSGRNLIPFGKSVFFNAHSIVGYFSALFMFNLLSIDRLIAAVFPIYYQCINKKKYISLHVAIILFHGSFILFKIVYSAIKFPDVLVDGNLNSVIGVMYNEGVIISMLISPFVYAPALISYLIVAVILKIREGKLFNTPSDQSMSKVYRSLFLIVLVNMGSYAFGFIMFTLFNILTNLNYISFNLLNFTISGTIGGIFVNIGSASNAPILYINSSDYKKAYKKEFKFIESLFLSKWLGKQQSTVHPIS